MGTAVLASAGTNLVVLFPVAFMGTMVGRFLSPFATVMLIGIVVNNAILIAERRKQLIDEGTPLDEAVNLASADQLRPIIMITLAVVLGMLPLARGLGGEARVGIGVASIGGILVSAPLTCSSYRCCTTSSAAGRKNQAGGMIL